MSLVQKFISSQLAKPQGIFGRLVTFHWLEKENVEMNRVTVDSLELTQEDSLLEVGFGSGYLLETVLQKGLCRKVAGVDLSEDMVRVVRKRLKKFLMDGVDDIRIGDIESLPFADGQFSKLCSVNTLYFWKDTFAALSECRRVLRADGKLVLCFNSKESLLNWTGHQYGFSLYEVEDVERMLLAAGFKTLVIKEDFSPGSKKIYCLTGTVA